MTFSHLRPKTLLLSFQLGRERFTKILPLEHLADLHPGLAVVRIRRPLNPFDGLGFGLYLKQPEPGDQLSGSQVSPPRPPCAPI
jgi:hypothetical protein